MRSVDLAVYADVLAGRAVAIAARLEQARNGVRLAAIEREARASLDSATLARLEALGVLKPLDLTGLRAEACDLAEDLAAVERLQAWVEARLFEAREERSAA